MSRARLRVGDKAMEGSGRQDAAAVCVACDMQDLPVDTVVVDVAAGEIAHGDSLEWLKQMYPKVTPLYVSMDPAMLDGAWGLAA